MFKKRIIIILAILSFFIIACASSEKQRREEQIETNRALLTRGYEEVWSALLELISKDLEYPIEKAEKGVIETKWISVINVEGTMRFKLEAFLKKKNQDTEVKLIKKVQILEKAPNVPKRGDKEPEPGRLLGGWRTGESDKIEEQEILNSLKKKLGL